MDINNQRLLIKVAKAINQGQIANAYLLSGTSASPLEETAHYLAAVILDHYPVNENEINWMMITSGNHPDLLDIHDEKLKVESVEAIKNRFFLASNSLKGRSVYIINNIDRATPAALNKLLKFVEEPDDNLYAIFTTSNKEAVLPTILSRCQVVTILPIGRKELIVASIDIGVAADDAKILAEVYADAENIKKISTSESYINLKNQLSILLQIHNFDRAFLHAERNIYPIITGKEAFYLLLGLLEVIYKDITLINSPGYDIIFNVNNISDLLMKNSVDKLKAIMELRRVVELNTSSALLLDRLFCQILR